VALSDAAEREPVPVDERSDVRSALGAGVPAARVYPHSARASSAHPDEVRIAFDGDAVVFSDEAEQVFQRAGLDAFQAHETRSGADAARGGRSSRCSSRCRRCSTIPRKACASAPRCDGAQRAGARRARSAR